ncbi:MAG: IclR family transcriptional regulator C-terminal domain-containing protein [Ottowia sp.]|uniref:IclR family transcriptional regulator domain-containing protein n=1 Tax=Ottowia sp. TaxID=1898956 RepID=UPI003C717DB3
MSIARADTIDGLVKGLAVLESFDTERQRLNATQTAERAGLTRAAARRHLLTLAHLGYLETDGSYFWLSPRVLRLSGAYLASARLPRVIQPTLNRLAAETQDVYSAVMLDGDEVVIVARGAGPAPTTRLLAYGMHLGARLPAHATSTGRVLLAALTSDELDSWLAGRSLPRLTPHTTTDLAAFKALIEETARQDYCIASEEHELGVHAIAVPLRNAQGRTVAALNVIVPQGGTQQQTDRVVERLREAAAELRSML